MATSRNDEGTAPDLSLPSTAPLYQEAGKRLSRRAVRFRHWRNRKIASKSFRNWIMRIPGLRVIANRKAAALFRLTAGFVFTQVLSTCVRLGVFEQLEKGPRSAEQLAHASGTLPDKMQLLLEQAERLDLVTQVEPGSWMLDDAGAVVAGDEGIRQMVLHHEMLYRDLDSPEDLLKNPEKETRLKSFWAYARGRQTLDLNEDTAQDYSALMRSSQSMLADCILDAHDFGKYGSILDVGGGDGSFLTACAARHPDLHLHLFDLPVVADLARGNLNANGLANRASVHGGDFVSSPIPDTADCVSLVRILCDHDDDRVRDILRNLHASLRPGTKLMIAEAMSGPSEGARLAAVYFSFYFLAMGSGRCRSDADIKAMLVECGFNKPRTIKTNNPLLATLVVAER
ncbi:methyltransferase [Roseibium sp.]|uniref:methyltransferase n=1 Tax=Roseibium sp. TaxID=1936156 RepID=UPI003BA89E12